MKKIGLLLMSSLFVGYCSYGYDGQAKEHYIEVRGQAEMEVMPNEIFIEIILSEEEIGKVDKVEEEMKDAFEDIGIDVQKNLKVKDFSNSRGRTFFRKNVEMSKSYELKVTQVNNVSQVFEILEEFGVSQVWIGKVTHTDIKKFQKESKINAVVDAKEKAQAFVAPLNQKIGKAIYILDQGGYNNREIRPAMMLAKSSRSMDSEVPSPKLEFKKITIRSSILVRFELN